MQWTQSEAEAVVVVGQGSHADDVVRVLQDEGLRFHACSTPLGAAGVLDEHTVSAIVVTLSAVDEAAELVVSAMCTSASKRDLPVLLVGPGDDLWGLSELSRRTRCAARLTHERMASQLIYALRDATHRTSPVSSRRPSATRPLPAPEATPSDAPAAEAENQLVAARKRMRARFWQSLSQRVSTARGHVKRGHSEREALAPLRTLLEDMLGEAALLQLREVSNLLESMLDAVRADTPGPLSYETHVLLDEALITLEGHMDEAEFTANLASHTRRLSERASRRPEAATGTSAPAASSDGRSRG